MPILTFTPDSTPMSRTRIEMSFGKFEEKHWMKHYGKAVWDYVIGNYMNTMTYDCLPKSSQERKKHLTTLVAIGGLHFIYCDYNKDKDAFVLIDAKEAYNHFRSRFKRNMVKKECKQLHKNCNINMRHLTQRSREMSETMMTEAMHSLMLRTNNPTLNA